MKMGLRFGAVMSVLLGVIATTIATDSSACGNAVIHGGSPEGHIKLSETTINEGRVVEGYTKLLGMFEAPIVNGAIRKEPWVERAYLVAARGAVRTGGVLLIPNRPDQLNRSWRVDRATNLKRAEELFRVESESKPDDAIAKADLAEVRARFPEKVAEAKRALVELEEKGIMPSAWGYAALTRLRDGADANAPSWMRAAVLATHRAPREVSLGRCLAMTKVPEICTNDTVEVLVAPISANTIATDAWEPGPATSAKNDGPKPVKSPN